MNLIPMRNRFALLAAPLILALSACASNFNANVSRFQAELPAPAGQTFAIVAENSRNAGGLEFSQYAGLVAAQLQKVGYVPGSNPQTADLVVQFDYGVDKGRDKVRTTGRALDRLAELALDRSARLRASGRGAQIAVQHVDAPERALELAAEILRRGGPAAVVAPISAVLAAHTGPGVLGVVVSPA